MGELQFETTASSLALGDWHDALAAARNSQVRHVRLICQNLARKPPPFPGALELLLGRCLAEAGQDLDEAIQLLRGAQEANPRNVTLPHVIALAHLRLGQNREAAALFKKHGLPHDSFLLAQVALTLEIQLRPLPDSPPDDWPDFPPQFAAIADTAVFIAATETGPPDPADPLVPPSRPMSPEPKMSWAQQHDLGNRLTRWEKCYENFESKQIVQEVNQAMRDGLGGDDLHLLAGLACEEGGDALRARLHLARCIELEPNQLMARTYLARVYWRSGWIELAEDLWRSLPIEGPDDYGRHYHLALAHEAAGRRADALEAFMVALADFYMETREFYIERTYRRWLRRLGLES